MTENETAAPALTEEEKQAELQGRIESFNKELIPLLGKYELGLGAVPVINGVQVPASETFGARPIVFEARGLKKPAAEAAAETPAAEEAAPEASVTAA